MCLYNGNMMKELRKKIGLSQQDMGDRLGVSKSYVSQLENGKKDITDNIDEILQEMEQEYQDKLNKLTVRNKNYTEEYVNRTIVDKVKRDQLIKEIQQNRKQQEFNPSVLPSVDMIWLTNVLDKYLQIEFEREFLGVGEYEKKISEIDLSVDLTDKRYPSLQNGRYSWVFNCPDGKIHMEYLFLTKEMGNIPVPKIKVQFNPNKVKWDNKYLLRIMKYLGQNPVTRKFDICRDYCGMSIKDYIPTDRGRKDLHIHYSTQGSLTIQFGDMNKNGTRIYDKKGELWEKDKKKIPYECTRYETRVTLPKSIELDHLIRFGDDVVLRYEDGSVNIDLNNKTVYPVMNMINRDLTREMCGIQLTQTDVNNLRSMMSGMCTLWDFTKREQNRLKELNDNLSMDVITLTNVDIKQALITFITDYRHFYNINYNFTEITDVNPDDIF